LLEGKNVNLRIVEKEDLPLLTEWFNDPEFSGEFMWFPQQQSRAELEKEYDNPPHDTKQFFIEKKDGTKIGTIGHFSFGNLLEIFYYLLPSERGKGYGTEATIIMVDCLFLSKDIVRVQAHTDVRNEGSQKVLGKAGFKKEGIVRKSLFARGEWRDFYLYSILREEWKEPKILTKTEKK
jgi:RimJ/RimL family protein N-acetyltransferase